MSMKFLMDLQVSNQLSHDADHFILRSILQLFAQHHEQCVTGIGMHIDFNETKVEEKQQEKKMAQAVFDLNMLRGKKILSVNTDALEIRINAANAVYAIIKNVKKAYAPVVEQK